MSNAQISGKRENGVTNPLNNNKSFKIILWALYVVIQEKTIVSFTIIAYKTITLNTHCCYFFIIAFKIYCTYDIMLLFIVYSFSGSLHFVQGSPFYRLCIIVNVQGSRLNSTEVVGQMNTEWCTDRVQDNIEQSDQDLKLIMWIELPLFQCNAELTIIVRVAVHLYTN